MFEGRFLRSVDELGNLKKCFNICGNMHLKQSAQRFEQPLIPFVVDYIIGEGKQDTFNKNRS